MISKNITVIKFNQYTYDDSNVGGEAKPRPMPVVPVIKRFMINYSYEEKYKLGIITPQEFGAWQLELMEKNRLEAEAKNAEAESADAGDGATFWANDTGVRKNVSSDDYDKFLSENSLNVNNTNVVDVAALLQEHEADNEGASDEEGMDIPPQEFEMPDLSVGGDTNRTLSQAEIDALFAAAAG